MDFAELQEWSEKTYPELYPAEVHLRRAERNRAKMNDGELMFPGNRRIADHVFPVESESFRIRSLIREYIRAHNPVAREVIDELHFTHRIEREPIRDELNWMLYRNDVFMDEDYTLSIKN